MEDREDDRPVDMWIQYSDCELFADDMRRLVQAMRVDDVRVRCDEVWGGLHADAVVRRSVTLARAGTRKEVRRRLWPCGRKGRMRPEVMEDDDSSWGRLVKTVKEMAR